METALLTLNAIEIAPIDGIIGDAAKTVNQNQKEAIVKMDYFYVKHSSNQTVCHYLINCLVKELKENTKTLLGETTVDSLEVCTPASRMHTIYTYPYYRFQLRVRCHKDRYLLWIHLVEMLHISRLNVRDAAQFGESTRFRRFRYKNTLVPDDGLSEGIRCAELFPVHMEEKKAVEEYVQSTNPYNEQWKNTLDFTRQYLLPLNSIRITGAESIFETFPVTMPPAAKQSNLGIPSVISYACVSIVCKSRKKHLSYKRVINLLQSLNTISDSKSMAMLFHYFEEGNLLFKSKPSATDISNALHKIKWNPTMNPVYVLDGSLSKDTVSRIQTELTKRKIPFIHTRYNAPHFNLLPASESHALAARMLTLFHTPKPLQTTCHHLIISITAVSNEANERIGLSCCCTKDGICKEQEVLFTDQLDQVPLKTDYLLSLCNLEGFLPQALTFYLNTNIKAQLRTEIKDRLKQMSLDLPVYVVEITAPDKNPYVAFDLGTTEKHPLIPYLCKLDAFEYLLYLPETVLNCQHPLPVHIKLSKIDGEPLNDIQIENLLTQVSHFSRQSLWNDKGGTFPVPLFDAEKLLAP